MFGLTILLFLFCSSKIHCQLLDESSLSESRSEVCNQDVAPTTGDCRAFIPMFYYDFKSGICDCFVYTGCGGNENRFTNVEDCFGTCKVTPAKRYVSNTCKKILPEKTLEHLLSTYGDSNSKDDHVFQPIPSPLLPLPPPPPPLNRPEPDATSQSPPHSVPSFFQPITNPWHRKS